MGTITRRNALKLAGAGTALLAAAGPRGVFAQSTGGGTLRIAMTTTDVPLTNGMPDNGSEGGRFAGYPIFDALVLWDFANTTSPPDLIPGLATEWHVDPNDNKRWIFTIRQGVTFHDGSPLSVDDIVWNFDRQLNRDAPHYDKLAPTYAGAYAAIIAGYEKVSDTQFAIRTKTVFSLLPYHLSRLFIVGPRQYEKLGKDWLAFRSNPSGTGPFKVVKVTPHVAIELVPNQKYWDPKHTSKLDRLVLMPIADSNTRVAALRSGQVDWIEFPDPDSIPSLKSGGFNVVTKPYLHLWSFVLNCADPGPLTDVRVRRALNYGLDRESMIGLLNGTATPAIGLYDQDYKLFGKPTQIYTYDLDKAKALLAEAGYGPGKKPITLRTLIPTAGSGNMVPLPMGQFMQQSLEELNVKVDLVVADWGSVLTAMRQVPGVNGAERYDVICHGQPFGDPTQFYTNCFNRDGGGTGNWGRYSSPKVDQLLTEALSAFNQADQDAKLAAAHAQVVDDAPNIFAVHDLNPRAMSTKVKGFAQAESWYQDFTQITVAS
ncbi:MAG TPA: ABC transporter substrate-binding protein [Bordetella sp.]|nr:ABC transporter substrate-binding protein [Bordetella sp.]